MRHILLLVAVMMLTAGVSTARAEWVYQFGTGTAQSFDSDVYIRQGGEDTIHNDSEWNTKAWETQAIYYDMRLGYWFDDGHAWEIETLHHKMYMKNLPDNVSSFSISHGYNINTVNYAKRYKGLIFRIGTGVVMTHPETVVRGEEYEDDGGINGFYINGVAMRLGIEKRFTITTDKRWFLAIEAHYTTAYAEIPVSRGEASVPSRAVHAIGSIGYRFLK